jgi:hypothetical protein
MSELCPRVLLADDDEGTVVDLSMLPNALYFPNKYTQPTSSSVLLQFFFSSSSILLQFFFSSSSVLLQFFFSSSSPTLVYKEKKKMSSVGCGVSR